LAFANDAAAPVHTGAEYVEYQCLGICLCHVAPLLLMKDRMMGQSARANKAINAATAQ
jgi:hypothetical protein